MTYSHLLRAVAYSGLRGRSKSQSAWSTLWQPHHYTTRNEGDFRYRLLIAAPRLACAGMGQTGSIVRGYGAGGEKDRGNRIDEGLKGLDTDGGSVGKQDSAKEVQQEDVLGEKTLEAVVSPEVAMTEELEKEIEKDLVAEFGKPGEAESVKKEVDEPVTSATTLNLALDELGEPPERPLPGDCCGQGCEVCVWDTYNDELRDYLVRRKALLKKSK